MNKQNYNQNNEQEKEVPIAVNTKATGTTKQELLKQRLTFKYFIYRNQNYQIQQELFPRINIKIIQIKNLDDKSKIFFLKGIFCQCTPGFYFKEKEQPDLHLPTFFVGMIFIYFIYQIHFIFRLIIQIKLHNKISIMQQILETNEYYNKAAIRNNRILAGCIFYFEVAIIILYGLFVLPTPTIPNSYDQDLLITVGVAILVLIGFGLIFSFGKNKIWSSIGFTLFITAITFQLYFLISGFWTNVGISGVNKSLNWGSRVPVYLTDSNSINTATYGNTAIQAFKCSLANSIAFAAISGRAGPLEAFFISLVGTIAYELNRQLVSRYSFDFGGTMTIFCFGGFLGSTISLFLYYCKQIKTFEKHELRYSGKFSYFFVAIGSLFCWVFFPFLNIDIPISLVYNYSAGLNTFYCISACVVTSISLTCIINGKLDLKDVILSPVAGGVAAGSSAAIINDTLSALLLGIGASVMLISLLQLDKLIRWRIVVENYVFYLYAIIGACAGFASAIFSYESTSDSNYNFSSSSYATNFSLPVYYNQFIGVGISAGIGIVGGLILSPLICLINVETRLDHYHDRSYWIIEKDGISQQQLINLSRNSASGINEQQSSDSTVFYKQIIIKEERTQIKDRYAYL